MYSNNTSGLSASLWLLLKSAISAVNDKWRTCLLLIAHVGASPYIFFFIFSHFSNCKQFCSDWEVNELQSATSHRQADNEIVQVTYLREQFENALQFFLLCFSPPPSKYPPPSSLVVLWRYFVLYSRIRLFVRSLSSTSEECVKEPALIKVETELYCDL